MARIISPSGKGGSGAPSGVYADIEALEAAYPVGNKNVYITLNDGNWNYWNGTEWAAGGVYQASDGVVSVTDIINDTTTGGADKVASAETVKTLDGKITNLATNAATATDGQILASNGDGTSEFITQNSDFIAEGDINLYHTADRVNALVDAKTTNDLTGDVTGKAAGAEVVKDSSLKPKLQISQTLWFDGAGTISFSAFYHVFYWQNKTPYHIYAIQTATSTKQYQTIWKSTDSGNTWVKIGDITVDITSGDRLENICVDPWSSTIIILKKKNTTPITYEVNTYNSTDLTLLGTLDIGTASWHTATHNIDVASLRSTNTPIIMFAEYAFTGAPATTMRVWKTVDRGVNWTTVFTQDVSATGVKHLHTLQCDPFTSDWWLSSGDGDTQSKIWRSQDDGATWDLLFEGSQEYRTLSFVFEKDYIYWGMDSPSYGVRSHVFKLNKTTLEKVSVATAYNDQAIYGLTKTFYPDGILVWLINEVVETHSNIFKIQFYSYKDSKLYDVAEFDSSSLTGIYGFIEASRYQSLQDGSVFALNKTMTNIYKGNSTTRSSVMRCKLTM